MQGWWVGSNALPSSSPILTNLALLGFCGQMIIFHCEQHTYASTFYYNIFKLHTHIFDKIGQYIIYTMQGGRVTLKDPWIFYIIIVKVQKINPEKNIPWVIHSVHKPHYLLVQAQETCED